MLVLTLAAALGLVCLSSTAMNFVSEWRSTRNPKRRYEPNVLSFPHVTSGPTTDEPGKVA